MKPSSVRPLVRRGCLLRVYVAAPVRPPADRAADDAHHGNLPHRRGRMGAVSTAALLVAAFLYPLWGYLYDRYARSKLLALASLIWGSTTWLSAIAPTYPTFLVTRACHHRH